MNKRIANNSVSYKRVLFLLLGLSSFLASPFSVAGDVKLTWDASPSARVGGYKLYVGQASKTYTSSIDVGNNTNYTISGLTNGGTYFFALKAYNTAKSIESSFSNEVKATVAAASTLMADFTPSQTKGSAPLIVTFNPNTSGIVLGWQWSFGTSAIPNSTSQTPTVTFSNPGIYNVVLTAMGANGITTTASKQINVVAAPAPANTAIKNPAQTKVPVVVQVMQNPRPQVQPATVVAQPPPIPVAAFGFEEKKGKLAKDSSGYGNHGIIKQAIRVKAGRYGKALKFDGVDDWVTVKPSDSLNLSTGYTLEAWIKPLSIRRGNIIAKQQANGTVYDLYAYEDGDLPISSFNDGLNYNTLSGSNQLPIKQWLHLAGTFDGKIQRLYVNGVLINSSFSQSQLVKQSGGVLRIGGNSVWKEFFHGCIDELRIYNRALNSAEIQKDINRAVVTP